MLYCIHQLAPSLSSHNSIVEVHLNNLGPFWDRIIIVNLQRWHDFNIKSNGVYAGESESVDVPIFQQLKRTQLMLSWKLDESFLIFYKTSWPGCRNLVYRTPRNRKSPSRNDGAHVVFICLNILASTVWKYLNSGG